jgi:hypothetical protein
LILAAHDRQTDEGGRRLHFALALDTLVQMFKPPFAFREFLLQTWFIARACADYHAVDSVHRHGGPGL